MVRSRGWLLRAVTLTFAVALPLAACGGNTGASTAASSQPSTAATGGASAAPSGGPQKGGTIVELVNGYDQLNHIDPQRVYTGEFLAFFSATMYRSLEAYVYSPDNAQGTSLTPDMATDLGTHNADATQWSFTLRDGITFQDGSAVTCQDIAYGVSRTFATDVITGGPTYAIAYLAIPQNADGTSKYPGPYKATAAEQAMFDQAVTCDGNTITFNLNQTVADFNYTVTLGFSPVPKAKDTGENYDAPKPDGSAPDPVSSGPYQFQSYTTGQGGKLVLVRNPNWNPDSDPYRKAYPDKWEMDFGLSDTEIDQRLIADQGSDVDTIDLTIQPQNLATVFSDPNTPNPDFAGRAVNGYDPYTTYYCIDVKKVPNVKIRNAMQVALDRASLLLTAGGAFSGQIADGVIKPNIGQDYAATGMWTTMFGQAVPDSGDPDLAKQLIAESGVSAPSITYDYPQSDTHDKEAAIVVDSLSKAGFKVTANPISGGKYYSVIFDPTQAHELMWNGWGPDWPNASTVIPPLTTPNGGWDISRVDDPAWLAKVKDAQTTLDRATQATKWQELDKEVDQNGFVIPIAFTLTQELAGSNVEAVGHPDNSSVYLWPAYGSWPYGAMYLKDPTK
jgi:peptide/nickel transport system substrate-binding protein